MVHLYFVKKKTLLVASVYTVIPDSIDKKNCKTVKVVIEGLVD